MNANHVLTELDVLRPKWTWLLFTGTIMVILGTTALFIVRASTLGIAVFTGWILAFVGIIEMVHAFRLRRWAGFYLHLIGSVLGIFIGLIVVTNPLAGGLTWRLLFASFLTAVGLVRLIAAISLKFNCWGYAVLDGAVTLGLGILLWANWPWSGLSFIGLSVALFVILRGFSYVMFALAIRFRVPLP